jgi:hypothetical protein
MDYGMIGQIAKAKLYAGERQRIRFTEFVVQFTGNNNVHTVTYGPKGWACDASFFQQHGWSCHTIALERILDRMITPIDTAQANHDPVLGSSLISQIEKAKQYTEERDRVRFVRFSATFAGENHDHIVTYDEGKWHCTCHYFATHDWCSHSNAVEHILEGMVRATPQMPLH